MSKFKAIADSKIALIQISNFFLGRVENIMGKGENVGLPAFSPFPTIFSRAFYFKVMKSHVFLGKGLKANLKLSQSSILGDR